MKNEVNNILKMAKDTRKILEKMKIEVKENAYTHIITLLKGKQVTFMNYGRTVHGTIIDIVQDAFMLDPTLKIDCQNYYLDGTGRTLLLNLSQVTFCDE